MVEIISDPTTGLYSLLPQVLGAAGNGVRGAREGTGWICSSLLKEILSSELQKSIC